MFVKRQEQIQDLKQSYLVGDTPARSYLNEQDSTNELSTNHLAVSLLSPLESKQCLNAPSKILLTSHHYAAHHERMEHLNEWLGPVDAFRDDDDDNNTESEPVVAAEQLSSPTPEAEVVYSN